ncbi:BadF/BadG/BcrA/BcrD ATPase family protein [Albirhodobacter sp. R86504]|uniref:BadF/BadG/BcrA/BcrD ATPase family protein n=1 Tax=Albirhodobacter sp. R86504 TaxID=3093848 RepID=UPI00366ADB2E
MFYLGIDGGGTGCRARLVDRDGNVLGEGASGPANIATDRNQALHNILTAARQATDGKAVLADINAGLGLAGASLQDPRDWLAAHLPFKSARIVQDVETSLIGALGRTDGILAAIGTGSVFASRYAQQTRVIGGWGLRLGDEGSGAWMGRELCRAALRAYEGAAPDTPLLIGLREKMGGAQGIVAFGATATPADFASLARDLLPAKEAGDPAALIIFKAALGEITTAIVHLQPVQKNLPVVLLGGLGSVFSASLSTDWNVIPAKGTSLDGAVALAMEAAK